MFRCKKCEEKQTKIETLETKIKSLEKKLKRYEEANLEKFFQRQNSSFKKKDLPVYMIKNYKNLGYSNRRIAKIFKVSESTIRRRLKERVLGED